ncbi:MAG: hypothetical protein HQL84_17115 [Magnetococcales bacterium]|nr:hypothetical protein [Magnetococcales bacterium]
MSQPITINQMLQMSLGEVASLPALSLVLLQQEIVEIMTQIKLAKDMLDNAMVRRFGDRAVSIRQESGKDFGMIRFQDGEVEIAMDVPKRPSWDQEKLAGIVRTIRESGDDPSQYVKMTYDIEERKFIAWPDNIRRVFEPARMVKPGKASFKLTVREQEAA